METEIKILKAIVFSIIEITLITNALRIFNVVEFIINPTSAILILYIYVVSRFLLIHYVNKLKN